MAALRSFTFLQLGPAATATALPLFLFGPGQLGIRALRLPEDNRMHSARATHLCQPASLVLTLHYLYDPFNTPCRAGRTFSCPSFHIRSYGRAAGDGLQWAR